MKGLGLGHLGCIFVVSVVGCQCESLRVLVPYCFEITLVVRDCSQVEGHLVIVLGFLRGDSGIIDSCYWSLK